MSQFILQPFFRLSYVIGSSATSPGEPPMGITQKHTHTQSGVKTGPPHLKAGAQPTSPRWSTPPEFLKNNKLRKRMTEKENFMSIYHQTYSLKLLIEKKWDVYVENVIQSVKKFRIQSLRVYRGDKTKPFCYVTNIGQVLRFLARGPWRVWRRMVWLFNLPCDECFTEVVENVVRLH